MDEELPIKNDKVRLLLADGHSLFRTSLKDALGGNGASRFVFVGEASSGPEVLEQINQKEPDIVLLDIGLPGMDGIACARYIKKTRPHVTVLVLSPHDDELHVMEAFEAGANGYLSKRLSPPDLLCSLETIHQACYLIPPGLMNRLRIVGHKLDLETRGNDDGAVTRCELKVLSSLAHGRSNKQIAEEIFVSEKTVKNHLNHLFKKLGVKNRTEALLKAMERGLVYVQ